MVCNQMSEFLEANNLFPKNQHGFRPKRSTMTAWEEIQLDWAENTENKNISGILLWDLSAAFNTLDVDVFCEKIKIYGFQPKTVEWFRSFLTGRYQRVKICCLNYAPHISSFPNHFSFIKVLVLTRP